MATFRAVHPALRRVLLAAGFVAVDPQRVAPPPGTTRRRASAARAQAVRGLTRRIRILACGCCTRGCIEEVAPEIEALVVTDVARRLAEPEVPAEFVLGELLAELGVRGHGPVRAMEALRLPEHPDAAVRAVASHPLVAELRREILAVRLPGRT